MLTPLGEHELLVFWTQLLVLVSVARALGYVMRRIGLPSVIGELAAGVVLGPSIFGKFWPEGFHWFLPDEEISSGALFAISWLGVALLLVSAGFETDLALIRRLGRAAALVTGFSLVLPFVGGLVMGSVLPDSFVGSESDRTVFVLFVAAALSVSALAVIAKILSELGLMRRDFGQITVAAGMANDVVGWVMLAVFTGFATDGEVSFAGVLQTVLGLTAFLLLAMTLGQTVVDHSLRFVRREGPNIGGALGVTVFTMLVFGVATQALGIEAVLGAFVAGVVLNRSRFQQPEVIHHIEGLTMGFLAPVFFATAGLRVDLGLLGEGGRAGLGRGRHRGGDRGQVRWSVHRGSPREPVGPGRGRARRRPQRPRCARDRDRVGWTVIGGVLRDGLHGHRPGTAGHVGIRVGEPPADRPGLARITRRAGTPRPRRGPQSQSRGEVVPDPAALAG